MRGMNRHEKERFIIERRSYKVMEDDLMNRQFILSVIRDYANECLETPKRNWNKHEKKFRAAEIFVVTEIIDRLKHDDSDYPIHVLFDMKEEMSEYASTIESEDMALSYTMMQEACRDLIELFL